MSSKLPYLVSPGTVPKVLEKIIEAKTPERFTVDFLGTRLGFKGGNARPIIPLLKRLGFLSEDGTPTDVYRKFRTESGRGAAMAVAMRRGYDEVFSRNEYAHDLSRQGLKDLVYEITGAEKGNTASEAIVSTFFNLKDYAEFDAVDEEAPEKPPEKPQGETSYAPPPQQAEQPDTVRNTFGLGYTININLPETTDVEVYNAIFEALDNKLLK